MSYSIEKWNAAMTAQGFACLQSQGHPIWQFGTRSSDTVWMVAEFPRDENSNVIDDGTVVLTAFYCPEWPRLGSRLLRGIYAYELISDSCFKLTDFVVADRRKVLAEYPAVATVDELNRGRTGGFENGA